jgi:hypothetical protein
LFHGPGRRASFLLEIDPGQMARTMLNGEHEVVTMRATSESEVSKGETHEPGTVRLFRTSREDNLLRRVRGEYRDMPGMRLTIDQAMRFWMMDWPTCTRIFDSLVAAQFLELDNTGRYRKVPSAL